MEACLMLFVEGDWGKQSCDIQTHSKLIWYTVRMRVIGTGLGIALYGVNARVAPGSCFSMVVAIVFNSGSNKNERTMRWFLPPVAARLDYSGTVLSQQKLL